MNDLTKRLYAEGWTREHHPDYVFWGDWENFSYKWEFALGLVWKTPCGLFVEGRSVAGNTPGAPVVCSHCRSRD